MTKYSLDQNFLVDVIYKEDLLPEDNTLIDVAYSYNWRKVNICSWQREISKVLTLISVIFQTSPMRFYYRIYQKTKVLTRKRKKKSTKTNQKSHPAKKRKTDAAPNLQKSLHNGNSMEVDEVENKSPKISTKINGDGAKDKNNGVKEIKKVIPVIKNSSPKVSFGGVETKPVKSVTINQNVSYSNSSDRSLDKVPTKSKPLSPILKNVSSDKSGKLPPPPTLPRSSPVTEAKSKSPNTSSNVNQKSIKASHSQSSKKTVTHGTPPVSTPTSNKTSVIPPKPPTSSSSNKSPLTNLGADKKSSPGSSVKKDSSKEKVTQLPVTANSSKVPSPKDKKPVTNSNGVKHPESSANNKSASNEKPAKKIIPEKKAPVENQVVEISVEVSASDIKKVLEKKKAEKDAKMIPNGEERLFSNYSIVDQLKKSSSAAANLANQKKQASMMDFTRSSEAFNGPKVPPNVQGLEPKKNSGSETNVLSAIVHSLARKQESLNQKIQAATNNSSSSPVSGSGKEAKVSAGAKESPASPVSEVKSGQSEAEKLKQSEARAKTLGTMVGPGLSTKTSQDKPVTTGAAKLPISTSIKPITKDNTTNSTSVETSGSKGQQMINFLKKNNTDSAVKPNKSQESAKNAESLTKNIPAGTTVTVKTVETKQPAKTPSPSSTPTSKGSAFRMNLSNSNNSFPGLGKGVANPFTTSSSSLDQAAMMSGLHTQMTMALAQAQAQQHLQQQQYLNQVLSGQLPQLEAAAAAAVANANYNLVARAAAAAQITQSPMTTLAFTKPISSSEENRFGLKIPQPSVSRQSSPGVQGNFGSGRLQVKVNSDSSKSDNAKPTTKSPNRSLGETKTSTTSPLNKIPTGIHSMPAMIPFHDMKRAQAIPKSAANSSRSLPISSLLNKSSGTKSPSLTNSPSKTNSPVSSDSFKSSNPVKQMNSSQSKLSPANSAPSNPLKSSIQTQSLKKLVTDLNSLKQKKADNLHNTLKKNSENLLSESKKAFLGIDQNINEKSKEVTSS